MIEMRDAMRAVKNEDPKAIVLLAETSIMAFADVSEPDDLYLPVGSMSKASSVGLGVALAQPEKNVVIFDGDGSLLMNLGSLVTVGIKSPPRGLKHRPRGGDRKQTLLAATVSGAGRPHLG